MGRTFSSGAVTARGAQSFRLTHPASGIVTLVNTHSDKCIDVTANGTAARTNIELLTCTGGANQEWRFVGTGSALVPAQSAAALGVANCRASECRQIARRCPTRSLTYGRAEPESTSEEEMKHE